MIRVAAPVAICVVFACTMPVRGQGMLHGVGVPWRGQADEQIARRDYESAIAILSKWLVDHPNDIESTR